jgi:hypothetical protein
MVDPLDTIKGQTEAALRCPQCGGGKLVVHSIGKTGPRRATCWHCGSEIALQAQPSAPQAPADPAQWPPESDALQATGETFFFEPEAVKFVRGETQTLPIDGCLHLFLIPFVLSGLLILILSVAQWMQILTAGERFNTSHGGPLGLCVGNVCWWAVISVLVYFVLGRTLKRRRLAREGTLINGEIVQCSGHLDSDRDFQFKAEVRFRSPQTGQLIYKTFSRQCNHLRDKPLPRPGTSIYLLYIDEKTYEPL